jgi:hypothetical protein
MSRRCLVGVLGLLAALVPAPLARADGRPPDASGTVCTYRVPEAVPYDTPEGRVRVHYVGDPADPDSPSPASTRIAGVPDWVVAVGEAAEGALTRETALGFPPPPADDGDGAERGGDARYDVYVCDLASHDLGELAATVPDPSGSGFSYIVVGNDYAAADVAPLATTGIAQLRVTLAHELFHAIQLGESRGRLPEWLAEATAVWMEGIAAPPDVDREIYRVALGGAGTEEPFWQGGDLHEYGTWWLVQALEREHPGFVRRLLAFAAARGDGDPRGLHLLARALGGRRVVEASFRRFARTALEDPLVGRALRARRTSRLPSGGRLVISAVVQPLSLRLWRVPASGASVTLRRSGARRVGLLVRRGSAQRSPRGALLRLHAGSGSLLLLVIGGAGSAQNIRLTLTAAG